MNVKTRIAPSPTGHLHIGTARVALFNYLFAKQNNGSFIVRIEDTDKERSKAEFEEDILENLNWLGISGDEIWRQSERAPRHREALETLIANNHAYISKEPAKNDPEKMVEVVRLRASGKVVSFEDSIRGIISFDTKELGDFVIARSLDEPLYHLAVVVDDADAHISHVIRGEDHISNTPRQILILEMLGYPVPHYAHLPLVLSSDKSKLSKRRHATSIREYRMRGFLPEAMINYLALLGWHPESDKEIFSMDELVEQFDLTRVQKGGAILNEEKLLWFNRHYMQQLGGEIYEQKVKEIFSDCLIERKDPALTYDDTIVQRLVPVVRERVDLWEALHKDVQEGEYDFFFGQPRVHPQEIPWKQSSREETFDHMKEVKTLIENISVGDFGNAESIKAVVWPYAEKVGRGAVLWPLRYALTGKERSPDPFVVASILGKEETLRRIEIANEILSA